VSTRRSATGLTGPVIIAMLGGLLIVMAVRVTPVLWAPLVLGVGFLVLAVALFARQGRARREPRFARGRSAGGDSPEFMITLRGYDVVSVDDLVLRARDALSRPAARRRTVREEISAPRPPVRLRGYAVPEVDAYLRQMAERLADPAP
jgi:hypothetical protein